MKHTNDTIGKVPTILQLVSASATKPTTFVLREVRELRQMGFAVEIGQLRPLFRHMSTGGFDELAALAKKLDWWSPVVLVAILYYAFRQPRQLWSSFLLIFRGNSRLGDIAKMFYVLISSMKLAFRYRNYDDLHIRSHFLHTEALAAYFVCRFLRVSYSITVHTVVVHFPVQIIGEVVRNASFVVADTVQVREFLESLPVPRERIRLIRNGLPLHELKFQSDRPGEDPPILLAAGYLVPKKGFDVLLLACSLLLERRITFRCVIVGDGAERRRLDSLTKGLGLQDHVKIVGNLPFHELKQRYYQATIFVMPSVRLADGSTDGLPTVLLEALACGTPVVGTNVAAIPEVIVHGRTGFLVPPNAPEAMADQIESLLEQETLRASMSQEGRRLIEEQFDVRRNSEILAKLILSGPGASSTLLSS